MSEEKRGTHGVHISDLYLEIGRLQDLLSGCREENFQLSQQKALLSGDAARVTLSLQAIKNFTDAVISYQDAATSIRELWEEHSGTQERRNDFLTVLRMMHRLDEDSRKLARLREKWWYRFFSSISPV